MKKKAIIAGVLCGSILLVGCNKTEALESEQEVVIAQENGGDDWIFNYFSEIQDEITESTTRQTELDGDSLAIMVDGGIDEMTASVGFPKDADIDPTLIQQIVEDSIQNVSERATASGGKVETKIKIKVEEY